MKKSLLALAALTAFAGVASAQSSVTLFGIVDVSVTSGKSGPNSLKGVASDQLSSNRLGFRGVEDLGGGLKAGFWIEGAMAPDTGTAGGQTWQRRSTVSLMGGFGEVRLGRDYTPSFWNYTVFDPFGTNGPGSMLNLASTVGSSAGTLVRANNTVGYFLPAMGGLYGQLMVAAGEGVKAPTNKYTGGRIGYAAGPLNVAAAYGKTSKDGSADVDDFKDRNIGASFAIGPATIIAQYSKRDYSTFNQKTALIGGTYAFGASTLKASFTKSTGSSSLYEAKQVAVGYQYDLSKRTSLYGTFSSLNNGGDAKTGARYTVGASAPAQVQGGDSSKGLAIGVRHAF
ncbi:MAG: porin [Rubrivivax sp.]